MLSWLSGKKTYILGGVTFVVAGLKAVGVEVPDAIVVALVGLISMALRSAISNTPAPPADPAAK